MAIDCFIFVYLQKYTPKIYFFILKYISMLTLKRSLTEEMEDKLNKQIKMEGLSSFYYLAMASWCETHGYLNASQYLYDHADEERMHMMKIIKYVNEAGGYALAPEIKNLRYKYNSLKEVFTTILEHELAVTTAINNLMDACYSSKDFATMSFLQWYVNEQREEEAVSRRILEFFDLIGEEGQGLWLIDQEIGKLSAQMKQAAAAKEKAA